MIKYESQACNIAAHYHANKTRKYTGEPYFNHLQNVANKVTEWGYQELAAMAYLHDVVEDTDFSHEDVEMFFNKEIAQNVWYLTDVPLIAGNRSTRNALNNARLAGAPEAALIVKCADMIDNMHDIIEHDPKFAKVYLGEIYRKWNVMFESIPKDIFIEFENEYMKAKGKLK